MPVYGLGKMCIHHLCKKVQKGKIVRLRAECLLGLRSLKCFSKLRLQVACTPAGGDFAIQVYTVGIGDSIPLQVKVNHGDVRPKGHHHIQGEQYDRKCAAHEAAKLKQRDVNRAIN